MSTSGVDGMNKYKLVTPSRVRTDQRVARDFLALVSGPLEMLLALLVFTKREIRLAILQALVKYFEIHDAEAEVSTTGAHDQNAPNLRLDGAPVLSLNDILPDLCADAGLPPPPGKLELRLPQLALLPLAGAPAQPPIDPSLLASSPAAAGQPDASTSSRVSKSTAAASFDVGDLFASLYTTLYD